MMEYEFAIEESVRKAAPDYRLLALTAHIANPPTPDALWQMIEKELAAAAQRLSIDDVRMLPAVEATRRAYKMLGKDPNRYRPSADALLRRAVRGLGLYRSLAVIDVVNLLSLRTGISIGAFDAEAIAGNRLVLGAGRPGEPYEAIGRGQLNIENMPVWRDATGGIGTPTSDNVRTKLTGDTRRLLMLVNMYHGATDADAFRSAAEGLLASFGNTFVWTMA